MKALLALTTAFLVHASQSKPLNLARQASTIDYNAAPPNLSTLANGSLFETWRPRAHVLPPSGHTGDPTGHYVDTTTGNFHVGYLYSQEVPARGGAAAATTEDFVTYTDIKSDDPRFIAQGGINDPVAVFDGTVIASGYKGLPTFIYTAVSFLPISWTLPYTRGSETQAIAVSEDGSGRNFTKLERGPVISDAPFGLNVTGWRDPFEFRDPVHDELTGSKAGTTYLTVSGGVHAVGPCVFLYRQYDKDFMQWEYLGRTWQEPANSTWGDGTWAGRWGFNFEVVNTLRLDNQGASTNGNGTLFHLTGTEGGRYGVQGGRQQQWAAGSLAKNSSNSCAPNRVSFEVNMAGILDGGLAAYAAAGKFVSNEAAISQRSGAPDRYITWVWLTGDFYGTFDFPVAQQGWDSTLLTPRELYVKTIENVVDNSAANEVGSWRPSDRDEENGTVTLETLGQTPVREAIAAYKERATQVFNEPSRDLSGQVDTATTAFQQSPGSRFYMLEASLSFPSSARESNDLKAGFQIHASNLESTNIYYQFSNESFVVDRSQSTAIAATTNGIDTRNEAGRFRFWDIKNPSDGTVEIETLDLQIIVDNSIIEIFANGRFALSTQVYPWYANSTGISYFVEGGEQVAFSNVTVYEGLTDAWPERSR